MSPELILQIVMALGGPIGIYVGIKADLVRALMQSGQAAESAKDAHSRLDDHVTDHLHGQFERRGNK